MNNMIGNRIYNLRNEKRLTQEELARQVGVSRQALSKWERGEGLPDLYNTQALAKALDVSVDDLIGNQNSTSNYNNQAKGPEVNEMLASGGNYIKKLLLKAKKTTNTKEAKNIRKKLLTIGVVGIVLGFFMVVGGFIGFGMAGMNAVQNFNTTFNPFPYIIVSFLGMGVLAVGIYSTYAGLAIVVAGVTTSYLDTREKCPNCGDEIDKDELRCSHCGYDLSKGINSCNDCGYDNKPGDLYCRKCGNKLD